MKTLARAVLLTALTLLISIAGLGASSAITPRAAPGAGTAAVAQETQERAGLDCFRRDFRLEYEQVCQGWGRTHSGAGIYQPTSYWIRNKGTDKTVQFTAQMKLSDISADGKCAWAKISKTGAYAYDDRWFGKVCGKGTTDVVDFTIRDLPYTAPGQFRIHVCGGPDNCRILLVRRFVP